MDGTTALAVLGLRPGASRHEIKAAFRTGAKAAHPDHAGAADSFVALLDAYRTALRTVEANAECDPGLDGGRRDVPRDAPALHHPPARRHEPGNPTRLPARPNVAEPIEALRHRVRRPVRWVDGEPPRPSLDVRDITPRGATGPAWSGRRPAASFEQCLAEAMAA